MQSGYFSVVDFCRRNIFRFTGFLGGVFLEIINLHTFAITSKFIVPVQSFGSAQRKMRLYSYAEGIPVA